MSEPSSTDRPDRKPFRPYSPANFRSRSHDSAHAEPDEHEPVGRTAHPLVCHDPPQFVDRPETLAELLEHLRAAGRFAYDSEFIGELTYIPKLCLIQVATADRVALIDPLVGLDLRPFWDLICDPSVEKVVHAGQQDIEPVFRNIGKSAANIFDTQISAGFVGLAYPVALSKLVLDQIGVKLGKGLTFTHWDQRPLSPSQFRYAADDVRYLIAVRDELSKKLDALGHADWARDECESLCDPSQYGFDPETYYHRIRGGSSLSPKHLTVLRELTIWRDGCARLHNVPARSFLRDEILVDLSRQPVKSVDRLDRVRGLPRPVEASHGAEIVAATARGLALPPIEPTDGRDAEPTPRQRFQGDAVWATFQCVCAGRSLDPNLVASRQDVGQFYRAVSAGESVDDTRLLTGWRRHAVGQVMLDIMAGKTGFDVRWTDGLVATLKSVGSQ